ncbi:MAG: hypothetical protein H6607_12355 [Flavobacteriales bacterium]|nr:hypothetical protein [Flavobacteriales bacterium]
MSINLVIEHPWFVLLCLLLGAAYSFILYAKAIKKVDDDQPKWAKYMLAILRFLSASFLAILLLNPLLKYLERTIEKPTVYLVVDQSESMIYSSDSGYVKTQLQKDIAELMETLGQKFEVEEIGKNEEPDISFNQKTTDISDYFYQKQRLYDGKNDAAFVVISDGIYNKGVNPEFAASKLGLPVYTVALGDSVVKKDVSIYSAKANAITFLGNQFPVEVTLNATKASAQNVELSIWQNGQKLSSKGLTIDNPRFSTTHTFILKADKVGLQTYTVRATVLNNELNESNNQMQVYTEVLDGRQKILVLAHAPHPDIAALRGAIENNEQYEMNLEIGSFSGIKKDEYDLVITHQLPTDNVELNYLKQLIDSRIPVLNIVGVATNINLLNSAGLGLTITGNRNNFNQGLAKLNTKFSYFEPDNDLQKFLDNVPPLTIPFGEYSKPDAQGVLAYQGIGNVKTEMPLWFFRNSNGYRSGTICGEGIWRWKLHDYEKNESHDNFNKLIQRSIQYLALKDDKRKFKVYTSSRSFFENENITFLAEVYNDSYEFTPDADVTVNLKHESGKQYEYKLIPQGNNYRFLVNALPPGNYSFSATAQINGKKENATGSFVVKELQLERQNLTANFDLMRKMAKETGGQMFHKNDMGQLADSLLNLPSAMAVSKTNHRFKDLINQKWLFFVLFFMLALEWFARRWFGGY